MAERTPTGPASDERTAGLEMRNAIEWLARVANCYANDGSGRLALMFDRAAQTLATPEIARDTQLSLHLPTLTFCFMEGSVPTPHPLDVDDRSSAEVEAWLLAELLHRGFERERFHKRLPYEWDGLMSGDALKYTAHDLHGALRFHASRLTDAADAIDSARRSSADGGGLQEGVRIAFHPDRCSLATGLRGVEVSYEMNAGEEARYRLLAAHAGDELAASSADRGELARRLADVLGP